MGTLALAAFFGVPALALAAFYFRAVYLALCCEVRPGLRCSEAVAAAAVKAAAALVAAAGSVAGVAVIEVALVATEGVVAGVAATAAAAAVDSS